MGLTLCKHCQVREGTKPRGLCGRCYSRPHIRRLYPRRNSWHARQVEWHGSTPLGEPTQSMPGSAERKKVYMERAAAKQALFHPLDRVRNDTELVRTLLEDGPDE